MAMVKCKPNYNKSSSVKNICLFVIYILVKKNFFLAGRFFKLSLIIMASIVDVAGAKAFVIQVCDTALMVWMTGMELLLKVVLASVCLFLIYIYFFFFCIIIVNIFFCLSCAINTKKPLKSNPYDI